MTNVEAENLFEFLKEGIGCQEAAIRFEDIIPGDLDILIETCLHACIERISFGQAEKVHFVIQSERIDRHNLNVYFHFGTIEEYYTSDVNSFHWRGATIYNPSALEINTIYDAMANKNLSRLTR